jgi:hypothetical protein
MFDSIVSFCLRVCPEDMSGKYSTSNYTSYVFSEQTSDKTVGPIGVKIEHFTNGYSVAISNKFETMVGVSLGLSHKNLDMTKPCRIKFSYPYSAREQILAQRDPEVMKKSHSILFFNVDYGIFFDTLSPVLVSESNDFSVHLWTPASTVLSTPWFKTYYSFKLPTNSSLDFKVEIFEPEDVNMDGKVNSEDLTLVLASWGSASGDVNGDAKTDAVDSGLVLSKWRNSSP